MWGLDVQHQGFYPSKFYFGDEIWRVFQPVGRGSQNMDLKRRITRWLRGWRLHRHRSVDLSQQTGAKKKLFRVVSRSSTSLHVTWFPTKWHRFMWSCDWRRILHVSRNGNFEVKPRVLFEVPVLLFFFIDITNEKYLAPLKYKPRENTTLKGHIVCYFPQDKEWSIFPGVPLIKNSIRIVSCLGKLYFASEFPNNKLICYDSLSNCWTSLPFYGRRTLHSIFSNNKGEIFAFRFNVWQWKLLPRLRFPVLSWNWLALSKKPSFIYQKVQSRI